MGPRGFLCGSGVQTELFNCAVGHSGSQSRIGMRVLGGTRPTGVSDGAALAVEQDRGVVLRRSDQPAQGHRGLAVPVDVPGAQRRLQGRQRGCERRCEARIRRRRNCAGSRRRRKIGRTAAAAGGVARRNGVNDGRRTPAGVVWPDLRPGLGDAVESSGGFVDGVVAVRHVPHSTTIGGSVQAPAESFSGTARFRRSDGVRVDRFRIRTAPEAIRYGPRNTA